MEATNSIYNFKDSLERIDEILNTSSASFEDTDSIPSREKLTYKNGYYVNCTAVFVDIRDSSSMTDKHRRPVLAKIYRSFISEMVALMNGEKNSREVNIHGDCVWGIYNTPFKTDIDAAFSLAARVCSLVDVLNYKLEKKGYERISIGVGMDYGRALMILAGYKGSGIKDVIWMGDVVNNASHLCNEANSGLFDSRLFLSNVIYNNLNDAHQKLCTKDNRRDIYQANVVNTKMNNWLKEQK